MFPNDTGVQAVKAAMMDPFEYLIGREKDGLLKKDFPTRLGNVSYHIPCHSRVQNVGQKTREMLEMVPDTRVTTVERCSGHAGTWGVKNESHEIAMKIGKPVFRQMSEAEPDYISSDCQLAAHHIEQGVAISLFVKKPGLVRGVWRGDVWGKRLEKYHTASEQSLKQFKLDSISPNQPNYLFRVENNKVRQEYDCGLSIQQILPESSVGIVTARDHLAVHFSKDDLLRTIQEFSGLRAVSV